MSLKQIISSYKSVNEFLGDLHDAVKDTPWPEAVTAALPWAGILGEAVADSVAPVKFMLKFYQKLTQLNTQQLAELACTVAFQRSVQQSLKLRQLGKPEQPKTEKLQLPDIQTDFDLTQQSFHDDAMPEFLTSALESLRVFLKVAGYSEAQRNLLVQDVRYRFPQNLSLLLSSAETQEKFRPLYDLIQMESPGRKARRLLETHAAYQRWLFEEQKILREEPYALKHIYVPTDCGKLTWAQLQQSRRSSDPDKRIDPFCDHPDHGGRQDALETVKTLLADPSFHDLIVIQGPAGSGKSSFTLRLCDELIHHGLRPIRIELKNLDTSPNRNIRDTLPEAVQLGNRHFDPYRKQFTFNGNLFQADGESIFSDDAEFLGQRICPYVLILDAWDEISVGASEGYQQHIERLLSEIRLMFLSSQFAHPIRIILTGRPTQTVSQEKLMMKETALLTLRLFTSEQLLTFHQNLTAAVQGKPLIPSKDWLEWEAPDTEALEQVRANFAEHADAARNRRASGHRAESSEDEGLELLGSPLLGLLSFRLFAQWPGDLSDLFDSRTVLYRSLTDLLLSGAKVTRDDFNQPTVHLQSHELRALLWNTAEAITVLDMEAIPKAELRERLSESGNPLELRVKTLFDEHKLSRLMISFFFHGGNEEQGCEFSHKSFREYLFAEAVVETLKEYGRKKKRLPLRMSGENYWNDFDRHNPRYELSRHLTRMLGPQWLTLEIGTHIRELIEWEIQRGSTGDPYPKVKGGTPTDPLGRDEWEVVRDALADLWRWWGEGIHLRAHPYSTDKQPLNWREPLAVTEAKRDRMLSGSLESIRPTRTTSIDAHLGDALFQLCCDVHRCLWREEAQPVEEASRGPYQAVDSQTGNIRFRPGAGKYWSIYVHRIGAAGFRERFRGRFPASINLSYVRLNDEFADGADLLEVILRGADLSRASLIQTNFTRADLEGADLSGADLSGAILIKADLSGADLSGVNLNVAYLNGANLSGADLSGFDLGGSYLNRADLTGSNLAGANLHGAELVGANLFKTNLSKGILQQAKLREANLSGASLTGADLIEADLNAAILNGADLSGANLSFADLTGVNLNGVNLSRAGVGFAIVGETYRQTLLEANVHEFEHVRWI